MKNKRYKVCRDNIYVGEVIRTRCVFNRGLAVLNGKETEKLGVDRWRSYRSILFTLNEDNLAEDLLYNSPNYPVLNISDDEKCMDFDEHIILVKSAYNISELLKYFGYREELTYEDIVKVRKAFFSPKFVYNYCELFGYKNMKPEELTYYRHGVEITDPKKRKKCIAYEKRQQFLGHRTYLSIDENTLSREYWDVLMNRKDNSLIETLIYDGVKVDSFAPYKREGKIKKLSR